MTDVATKPDRPATEADLLALPDEGRGWELIDGELVEKQSGFRHGRAHVQLREPLAPYSRRAGGGDRPGGWWFLVEQLVRFDSGQTLRPDVAGWLRERLPEPPEDEDTVVQVRPDWIAEIISPSNAGNDLVKKRRIYHRTACPTTGSSTPATRASPSCAGPRTVTSGCWSPSVASASEPSPSSRWSGWWASSSATTTTDRRRSGRGDGSGSSAAAYRSLRRFSLYFTRTGTPSKPNALRSWFAT